MSLLSLPLFSSRLCRTRKKALHLRKSMPYTDKTVRSNGAVSGMSSWLWHLCVCGWGSSITLLLWLFTSDGGKACVLMRQNVFIVSNAFAHRVYCKIILEYSDADWCMKFQGLFVTYLPLDKATTRCSPPWGAAVSVTGVGTVGYSTGRVDTCSGTVSEKLDHLVSYSLDFKAM